MEAGFQSMGKNWLKMLQHFSKNPVSVQRYLREQNPIPQTAVCMPVQRCMHANHVI